MSLEPSGGSGLAPAADDILSRDGFERRVKALLLRDTSESPLRRL